MCYGPPPTDGRIWAVGILQLADLVSSALPPIQNSQVIYDVMAPDRRCFPLWEVGDLNVGRGVSRRERPRSRARSARWDATSAVATPIVAMSGFDTTLASVISCKQA